MFLTVTRIKICSIFVPLFISSNREHGLYRRYFPRGSRTKELESVRKRLLRLEMALLSAFRARLKGKSCGVHDRGDIEQKKQRSREVEKQRSRRELRQKGRRGRGRTRGFVLIKGRWTGKCSFWEGKFYAEELWINCDPRARTCITRRPESRVVFGSSGHVR